MRGLRLLRNVILSKYRRDMGNLNGSRSVPISDVKASGVGGGDDPTTANLSSIRGFENGTENEAFCDDGSTGEARNASDTTELKLQKSVFRNGRFENPWPNWKDPTLGRVLKFLIFSKDHSNIPSKEELDRQLPVLRPDFDLLASPPDRGIRTTWIGHATMLIQMEGASVLTDPMFSERCSPSQYFGPKRFRSPACQIDELPDINAVLISHNHYDHLDANSVRALNRRFGSSLRWYVPRGLKSWMRNMSCDNVVELDWWEEDTIPDAPDVKIAFVPAYHWTKRTPTNEYKVLWGGFCVIGRRLRFYFPGDTGYAEVMFKQIGKKYGPFNLAALPIGAYEPRDFMRCQHCNPEDAVLVHKDIRAKQSVAMHWGTFALAHEFYLEPPQKLAEALQKHNLTKKEFFTMNLGETRLVDQCSELD